MIKKLKWEKVVTDKISGFKGKVIGCVDYATGCQQYLVAPEVTDDGTFRKSM